MTKIILSVAAVFAFGFANAQDVKFGVKGGVNFATLTGDTEDPSMQVGLHVGGFVEIKVSEKFSVQPELLYSMQGGKDEFVFSDGVETFNVEVTSRYDYLNIPIMAKYYVANKFSLEAGPQVGFLMSAEDEYESGSESEKFDVKDDMNSVDFGLNFGAGYDFTENLSAGIRYNLGLSNVWDIEGDDFEQKNSVLSLSVGYKF